MNDLNFTAVVNNIDITGLNKFLNAGTAIDIDDNRPKAVVKFYLDIEAREWGIKSISAIIQSVTAEINWSVSDDELSGDDIATLVKAGGKYYKGDNIEGKIIVDSKEVIDGKEWKVESELKMQESGQLMASEVSINLITKEIIVS